MPRADTTVHTQAAVQNFKSSVAVERGMRNPCPQLEPNNAAWVTAPAQEYNGKQTTIGHWVHAPLLEMTGISGVISTGTL